MATAAFSRWAAAGRPITPAQPIVDLVDALKARYPAGAGQFGWYADASHYESTDPEDHTPFSTDGWPVADPPWWVCATDVMVTAVGGVDEAQRLFDYWLAEAKAGRMPWLKYLIWKATLYDVRYGWRAQANADHYDHIHLSTRTDQLHARLGSWSPFPTGDQGGADVAFTPDQEQTILAQLKALDFTINRGVSVPPGQNNADIRQLFYSLGSQLTVLNTVVQHMSAAITAGGGSVDTAAVLTGVDAALAKHLADFRTQVQADTRDAVADAAEGGAAAVRAGN